MSTLTTPLRPELGDPPARIAKLPLDRRGYPVPWFVSIVNGEPEFRAMDPAKWRLAVRERRCWVCGERLGAYLAFVLGPMCGITRTSAEPPSHRDCARWSAEHCPFLSRPHMVRREDAWTEAQSDTVAGIGLKRNPGVTLIWMTRRYTLFADDKGRPLIRVGAPLEVIWICEGRTATRAEVAASVAGGYPSLLAPAEAQDREEGAGAVVALRQAMERFEVWYPTR
jgi:hypothetical protein